MTERQSLSEPLKVLGAALTLSGQRSFDGFNVLIGTAPKLAVNSLSGFGYVLRGPIHPHPHQHERQR